MSERLSDAAAAGGVFLSYSREDRERVLRLAEALEARGHPCWVDLEGIRPSAAWMEEIRTAIDSAPAFVFLASRASARSEVCREEVEHARAMGKRILPVALEDVEADKLPTAIASRNWIALGPDDDFERGLDELSRALDTEPEWAATHTRLLLRAAEWEHGGRDASFALRGRDLAAAEDWLGEADERKDPQPARLHGEYIVSSRRVATRNQRLRTALLGAGLVLTAGLAVFALIQKGQADRRASEASSRELAARALLDRSGEPEVGLLLALEAVRTDGTPEAETALRQLLPRSHGATALDGDGTPLEGAVLSPDGRLAAAAGEDGTGYVWNAADGRLLTKLRISRGRALDVAFDPDGRRVLSAAEGGSVLLWDARTGRRLARFQGLGGTIESVAFSRGGSLVAAAGTRGAAIWRTAEPGRPWTRLPDGGGTIWGVSFDPGGRRIATADSDGTVRVWDARDGAPEASLSLESRPGAPSGDDANSAVFSPDGRRLLIAADDGEALIWDPASGRVTTSLRPSADKTYEAAYSPDGTRIVTGSLDGGVRVWRLRGRDGDGGARRLTSFRAPAGQVLSASFGADDETVIAAESDGVARVWSTTRFDRARAIPVAEGGLLGADIAPDGRRIALAGELGAVVISARTGRRLASLPRRGPVRSVEFDRGGSRIAAAENDGRALVWRMGAAHPLVLPGTEQLFAASLSPDDRFLATAGLDGVARIWTLATRSQRPLDAHSGILFDVAFSPDGRLLATAGKTGVRLWAMPSGHPRPALDGSGGEASSIAFSPDGRLLAAAGVDGTVRVWEVASGRQLPPLRGADGALLSVAFDRGGDKLAAAGFDRAVRVWDVRSGQLLDTMRGPRETVTAIAFQPRGRTVLAASLDGSAYLLRCGSCLPAKRLEALAATRVASALTPGERDRYLDEATGQG